MTVGRGVTLLAGSFVLISILLAWLVHPWWIFLAVFVGLNLVQSSFTGFCPAANILRAVGLRGEV
ncbi:DUF2892 domain-containing protein [Maricaulis salignorans]|uniref:Inner membrane protein YgaP-like transmembrane domain-containing protein n=1 Tax=Maricaulis salignorans TaxID=144026 RepID=A0A1G9LPP3_9PROT|nr:DUF2892 domain-containing protein [Maricaulis salignorans]SDL63691.1 Protein of unknown function [Maricaulis salignorans]